MTEDLITVIDIGSSKIVGLVAEYNIYGKFEIIAIRRVKSKGIKNGKIDNIEHLSTVILSVISELEEKISGKIDRVAINISSSSVVSINSVGIKSFSSGGKNIITQRDVESSLENAKKINITSDNTILHFITQYFKVDDSIVENPIDMVAYKKLEVGINIIIVNSSVKDNYIKALEAINVNVSDIFFSGYASAEAVLEKSDNDLCVGVIDIGAGTTDVIIYEKGFPVFTFVSKVSADSVTKDLSQVLDISYVGAENLKLDNSCCYPPYYDDVNGLTYVEKIGSGDSSGIKRKLIYDIIHARMEENFFNIKEILEKNSYFEKIERFILVGGGSKMYGTLELAKTIFEKSVRIGDFKEYETLPAEYSSAEFATLIGMLKLVKKRGDISENIYRKGKGSGNKNLGKKIGKIIKEKIKYFI